MSEIDGDREADAATVRVDRRVDADHLAARVEQRAAAVARIDRRVGLDEVVVRTGANSTALRADDAHRHRVTETERIADRDRVFADANRVARSERDRRKVLGARDFEDREIEPLVAPLHRRIELALVRETDPDLVRVLHDVRVRHDVAARVDDETGAERLPLHPKLVVALVAPSAIRCDAERIEQATEAVEPAEGPIAEEGHPRHLHFLRRRDVHDRRLELRDELRDIGRTGDRSSRRRRCRRRRRGAARCAARGLGRLRRRRRPVAADQGGA